MPLSYQEIYKTIQESFPDTLVMVEDIPGDPYAVIPRDHLVKICELLRDDKLLEFDYCSCVSGADDTKTYWVIYHLYSIPKNHNAVLKVDAGKDKPWVPSVCSVWAGANWHERETYDMYGIRFENHPDLRRILLPEDWKGWPLRKDYDFPDEYQGIPLK